jgi:hypothetical protein
MDSDHLPGDLLPNLPSFIRRVRSAMFRTYLFEAANALLTPCAKMVGAEGLGHEAR